jgi:predicted permease
MMRNLHLRLRALFQKDKLDARMNEEMRSHIEMQTQENIEAGMSVEEARRVAQRQFGWVEQIKDDCRDQQKMKWVENLAQDVRYGMRMLRKNLAFTVMAVGTLALGIGATSAVFTIANTLLLKPMPWPDSERVVSVWEANVAKGAAQMPMAAAQFLDARREMKSFSALAAWAPTAINLASPGSRPERFVGASVSEDFLKVVKMNTVLGHGFSSENFADGKDAVVLLSYGVWKDRFGGRSDILGEVVQVNARSRTIVGILPQGFQTPAKAQFWVPKVFSEFEVQDRDFKSQLVLGRLRDGVTLEKARAELKTLFGNLRRDHPDVLSGWKPEIHLAVTDAVKPVRSAMILLVGAVLTMLLMACVNVASLLLARGAGRLGEFSVRAALGASRWRLTTQLLAESGLLALLGGGAGLLLAGWLLKILLSLAPVTLPRIDQVRLDGTVLFLTAVACLFTGLLVGLAPAWRFSLANPNDALRAAGQRFSVGVGWFRRSLVVFQISASVVVLIATGLLLRGFDRLLHVDLGFEPVNLMSVRIELPEVKYGSGGHREQFAAEVFERLRANPRVEDSAFATDLPMQGWPAIIMRTEDNPVQRPSEAATTGYSGVTPNYFRTIGMQLLHGRPFLDSDNVGTPLICAVNQSFARKFFGNKDPLGKRIEIGFSDPPNWMEIVGVVNDARNVALDLQPKDQVFVPLRQQPEFLRGDPALSLIVRTRGNSEDTSEVIRQAVWAVDKDQPLHLLRPMTAVIAGQAAPRRFVVTVLGFFAANALVLAALGLYGVMSHATTLRTREIGTRMAFGARRWDVLKLILMTGIRTLVTGLVFGIIGAFVCSRLIRSMLFEVPPHDPVAWTAVLILLSICGLLACLLPAWRASRANPISALRYE